MRESFSASVFVVACSWIPTRSGAISRGTATPCRSVTRCSVCDRPCVYEVEHAITRDGDVLLPAVTVPDVWDVVYRNRLVFPACDRCWGVWPDDWKRFPEYGFGRWPDKDRPMPEFVRLDDAYNVPAVGSNRWPAHATSAYELTLNEFLAYLRYAA
jgi:hypothetical protein